ncbi:MAG: hypothetical protein RLN88_07565 [Ekhidna sp.]|uniref:hypothetical protein n=1 Tax=Ekhidna sp. TaxID=2608089 RepID=UPI0032EFD8AC
MKLEDYFSIISSKDQILHFKLNGFWTKAIVDEIGSDMVRTFKEKVDSYQGKPFFILVDLTEFSLPSDEAKRYIKQTMDYGFRNHLVIAIEVAPKALVKMGIQDAASKSKVDKQRVQAMSVVEAYEIISKYRAQNHI